MMVGYDDEEDLLYVAVIARDDRLPMERTNHLRDGIEIYVSGLGPGSRPAQYRLETSTDRNSADAISFGAWRNEGDSRLFEWPGKVLDGRHPLELEEGALIGFDVVAVDNDGYGNTTWVPRGPAVGGKVGSNDRVGRLLLAPEGMSAADRKVLPSVLDAWNGGHENGLRILRNIDLRDIENLEGLGDQIEALVEQLTEHGLEESGPQAAIVAARMAGHIAAAAAQAGAIASAEMRMAQVETGMVAFEVPRQVEVPVHINAPDVFPLSKNQSFEIIDTVVGVLGGHG
jgi:hypothetical protein